MTAKIFCWSTTARNVLQARYTHGPGIDEPIAVTKGANTFFYHQDGLGSVTDLDDAGRRDGEELQL
jgi:hypothetical protein